MSVQLQQYNLGSETQQSQTGGVSGGITLHPQHQRYEGAAHNTRHSSQHQGTVYTQYQQ